MRTHHICKIIFSALFFTLNSFAQDITQYYENGKMGYKNPVTGQIIVSARFTAGTGMTQLTGTGDFAALVFENGKAGFINQRGEVIVPFIYQSGSVFSDGLASVKLGNKNGYIDSKGKTIIPFDYDYAADFKNGKAAVQKNDHWGFIDLLGNTVVPFIYFAAGEFSNDLAPVMNAQGNWGFINALGNFVIQPSYSKAESFRNGEALVQSGNKIIYIDTHGNTLRELAR